MAVKTKQTPPTEVRNAHKPKVDRRILLSDNDQQMTGYVRRGLAAVGGHFVGNWLGQKAKDCFPDLACMHFTL